MDSIIPDRRVAWEAATELINPIIEQHGLEEYKSGNPFTSMSTFSKVDQHIDHTIKVANWLIGLDI
jgi:hypothetical protein